MVSSPAGIALGLVGIALMLNPMKFAPGLIFDTRTVLISLAGLFFGYIPTIIAVVIAAVFRVSQAGPGVYMGVATIASAALLGCLWHRRLKDKLGQITFRDFYLFGVIVHLAMLACCIFLPQEIAFNVLKKIALPVLIIYPLATVLMGILLAGQYRRYKTQIALQASENGLRALFEQSADCLYVLDRQGRFLDFSPSACREMGYTREEMLEMSVIHIDPEFKQRDSEQWFWEKLPRDKSVTFDVIHHRKDGSTFPAEIMLTRLDKEDGVFVLASCRNVEERKRHESELAATRDFAENLINTANTMIIRLNGDGKLITFNQMAQEITGYTLEELRDKNWFEILVPQDRYPESGKNSTGSWQGGCPWNSKIPFSLNRAQKSMLFGVIMLSGSRAKLSAPFLSVWTSLNAETPRKHFAKVRKNSNFFSIPWPRG